MLQDVIVGLIVAWALWVAAARRLAARHGVDLGTLSATGPRGRICREDVLAAAGTSPDRVEAR